MCLLSALMCDDGWIEEAVVSCDWLLKFVVDLHGLYARDFQHMPRFVFEVVLCDGVSKVMCKSWLAHIHMPCTAASWHDDMPAISCSCVTLAAHADDAFHADGSISILMRACEFFVHGLSVTPLSLVHVVSRLPGCVSFPVHCHE